MQYSQQHPPQKKRYNRAHQPGAVGGIVNGGGTASTSSTPTTVDSAAAAATAHQMIMKKWKQTHYRMLKTAFQSATSTLENNNVLSTEMKSMTLRKRMYEYMYRKDLIDQKFDIKHRYCGTIIGMGSNESYQLSQTKDVDDDEEEEEEEEGEPKDTTAFLPFILAPTLKYKEIHLISAGSLHNCAIVAQTGQVISWGDNTCGALGRITNSEIQEGKPLVVNGFYTYPDGICEDTDIIQIAGGDTHTLFLSRRGNVYQCGCYKLDDGSKYSDYDYHAYPPDNSSRGKEQLDLKNLLNINPKPVHVYALKQIPSPVMSIHAGFAFSAAVLNDGTLYTWGMVFDGNLARSAGMTTNKDVNGQYELNNLHLKMDTDQDGQEYKRPDEAIIHEHFLTPKPVIFADDYDNKKKRFVIAVACGCFHILVVARDADDPAQQGKLYSSGANLCGQLGHGDTTNRHALTLVEAVKDINFYQVAAGTNFSLALSHDGLELYSFGKSLFGQLGIGFISKKSTGYKTKPHRVTFTPFKRIVSIDAGGDHALALTEDDELYSWGSNVSSAHGHPLQHDNIDTYRPKLLDLSNVKVNIGGDDDNGYCCRPVQFSCGALHSVVLARPMKK